MVKRVLRNHARLKWLALSTLNWFQQTVATSPVNWPRLPQELWRYAKTYGAYRRLAALTSDKIFTYPILFQNKSMGFDAHYVYQSVWATRLLRDLRPAMHIDVSSDLRFATLLSVSLPTVYVEYRSTNILLPGLQLQQSDLLHLPFSNLSVSSLSCLHVLEHIGLGRYGDPVDPNGTQKALLELQRVVAQKGDLIISVPVGRSRTFFNAHRILDPRVIPSLLAELRLVEFSIVTTSGEFIERVNPVDYCEEEYACGLYWFKRLI